MFATSTQKNKWIFTNKDVLDDIRYQRVEKFIKRFRGDRPDAEIKFYFLTDDEELKVQRFYERFMMAFCAHFTPSMPKNVAETAFHYYKRFYLKYTTMDYHPKEIAYTCVYLACKVEELNLKISHFMANIQATSVEKPKIQQMILDHEMLLMESMKFQLKIHSSFHSVEAYFDCIKTNQKEIGVTFNLDDMKPQIQRFLDYSLLTDIPLLVTPMQIALASIVNGVPKRNNGELDIFVRKYVAMDNEAHLRTLVSSIRRIRRYVNKRMGEVDVDLGYLEPKLNICRNQANDPFSKLYKPVTAGSDDDTDNDDDFVEVE